MAPLIPQVTEMVLPVIAIADQCTRTTRQAPHHIEVQVATALPPVAIEVPRILQVEAPEAAVDRRVEATVAEERAAVAAVEDKIEI